MEDKLNSVYNDIYNWLIFAEAKNAALLTLNSSLLFFSFKFINTKVSCIPVLLIYLFIILILISSIICLITFIAKLYQNDFIEKCIINKLGTPSLEDNILYYKDIAKYSIDNYYNTFFKKYNVNNNLNTNEITYLKDLINQIIIISKITYKKYFLFNIAICFTIIPFIVLLFLLILA
ncbi:hypothetical protein [Caldisalinibacter kiritimatiensis]|uniref:Pycsar effector protein domain-containing protein n=1 Tax=Caldisalinibacter kiritimatiensis TaxID=1304284 RepID=R1CAI7_9FIRM|nr:hypothetical protein [Caldisalinibacter kiritimatiensis]EOC99334.1 hypothetical protein L21TH_2592 [Caldisalinibacter kiritimatiensis]